MTSGPGVHISKRLVLINATSSIVQRVISLSVLLWLQQWLLGKVHPDEYAVYTLLFALMVFVPLVTGILGGAMARFITVEYARGDLRAVTQVTSTMFPLCLGGALVVGVVGLLLAWNITSVVDVVKHPNAPRAAELPGEARLMFALLVGMAVLRVVAMPFRMGLNVTQKFVLMNLIGVAAEFLRIGVLFALLFGVDTRVLWVVVASVPAAVFDVWITCRLSRRLVPALHYDRSAFRRDLFRPILSYGWWTLLVRLAVMLRETLSLVMLDRVGSVAVGTLGVASKFDNQIRRNALIMVPTMQPALTAMHATGQHDRLRRTYFRFSRYLMWVFLLIALPLIVYRDELWRAYLTTDLDRYSAAPAVMAILLARLLFTFAQAPIATISFARGQSRPLALCTVVTEAITLAATAILVLGLGKGSVGAAVAVTGVAIVAQPTLFWPLALRLTNARFASFWQETLWPGVIPSLAALPVWYALQRWLQPADLWTLTGGASAGALVYVLVLARFCLKPHERQQLSRLLGRGRVSRTSAST